MRRDVLSEVLSPSVQQAIADLVSENECPTDWTHIGFKRDEGDVLVSVGYERDHTIMVFGVQERDWPSVEPWWTQGSAF